MNTLYHKHSRVLPNSSQGWLPSIGLFRHLLPQISKSLGLKNAIIPRDCKLKTEFSDYKGWVFNIMLTSDIFQLNNNPYPI